MVITYVAIVFSNVISGAWCTQMSQYLALRPHKTVPFVKLMNTPSMYRLNSFALPQGGDGGPHTLFKLEEHSEHPL